MDKTINGKDPYEVMSALQKAVRRNMEVDALYWAIELIESKYINMALSRLHVIAHEDIGIADKEAVLYAIQCLEDTKRWYKSKNGGWRLALANAIMALCRAKKSREADNLQCVVWGRRRKGWKLKIPDYAIDKHTWRGKRMGRGEVYAAKESYKLVPPNLDDPYFKEATELWIQFEKTGEDMYETIVDKNGNKRLI